jgi:hypothetical protein
VRNREIFQGIFMSTTVPGQPQTIQLIEGRVLNIIGATNTVGAVYLLDPVAGGTNPSQSWTVGVGSLTQIGPFSGAQKLLVTCSVGSIDAQVHDASVTAPQIITGAGGSLSLQTPGGLPISTNAGGGVTPVAYSSSIPLDSNKVMPPTYLSSATVFAPAAGAVNGGACSVELVSDGVTIPTFPGFLQAASSSGFDTHAVGIINYVTFWYDGRNNWYSVSQPYPNNADLTFPGITPVIKTISTSTDGTQVIINYNVAINTPLPATSAFALSGAKTFTALTISGNTLTGTLSAAYLSSDTPTLSYTPPGINPISGAANSVLAPAVTSQAIVNLVGVTTPMQFTLTGSVTEAANTPAAGQYTYTTTASGSFGANVGISNRSLPANTDGIVSMIIPDLITPVDVLFGVKTTNVATGSFTTYLGSVSLTSTGKYGTTVGNSSVTPSVYSATVGDTVRIRRTAGNVIAEFAPASNPTSWSPIATLGTASTTALWAVFDTHTTPKKLTNSQASAGYV